MDIKAKEKNRNEIPILMAIRMAQENLTYKQKGDIKKRKKREGESFLVSNLRSHVGSKN